MGAKYATFYEIEPSKMPITRAGVVAMVTSTQNHKLSCYSH